MTVGISTVPAPTQRSVTPSRTFDSFITSPTVFSNIQLLQPRASQPPGCCPNKVIIDLSTAVIIPDYSLYYNVPIEFFQPEYFALNDGSLIAPPFVQDLTGANASLLVTGILTMLSIRNIIVSGDYIRRVKVKRKTLFYVLFLSQILAPIGFVPIIVSYFNQVLNCTFVIILACLSGSASLALLITGILGIKAYKCLNNSRFVLIVLGLFQCASSGIVAMDLATLRGERRLTGSCIRISSLLCTRIFVLIQLFESLFICCCFMYACWKSRGSTDARGRISIQLSMEELPIEVPNNITEKHPTLRGWWDYVPTTEVTPPVEPLSNPKQDHLLDATHSKLAVLLGRVGDKPHSISPKTLRPTFFRPSRNSQDRQSAIRLNDDAHGRASPTPSSFSRLGRLVPHMELFQKVMKDELLYITFITATCVVVAVLAVIGLNFKNGLTVTGWIALNWSVISLLAIHSFGRVVCRHERDALLQHPSMHHAIIRASKAISSVHPEKSLNPRKRSSRASRLRFRPEGKDNDLDNPFSDSRGLEDSRMSWHTIGSDPPTPGPRVNEYSPRMPVIPPSPSVNSIFPMSGRSTPEVLHQNSDGIREFSQSWLFEHAPNGNSKSEGDLNAI